MIDKKGNSILIVGNFLSKKGGNLSVCEELSSHLEERGWRVLTTSNKKWRVARLLDMVITCVKNRNHYSVAYLEVYSGLAFIWAEVVATILHLLKKKIILTLHGGGLPTFAKKWPKRVKRVLRKGKYVTSPSPYLIEQMKEYCSNIIFLPNGIDIEKYSFRLRKEVRPKIVWLRAFHKIYNPLMAIKVVSILKETIPQVELTMIGPDKKDGILEVVLENIKKRGLENHIKIIGKISKKDVPLWLNKFDIFINTTNVDNAPVSVIEAMACGLCVVSTNVGGIPYLIENGKDGLLVQKNNEIEMAEAISQLLEDNNLAQKISFNARKKAEEYDWKEIIKMWESLI